MKKQLLSVVPTLALIIPMSIIGFAGLNGRVKADIPFDFMVGGKVFKAGSYTVDRVSNNIGTLVIRGVDNNEAASFNVNGLSDKGEEGARLVFRRYGEQYFLAQIYDGVSGTGSQLMKSKAEREVAKKRDIITQNVVNPKVVTVAAVLGH
ncbi:MAG: hypothetical protein L0220_31720 [Acidobacteria bacterium]|nr:hypothetical protein [Acidobacteriota bacterium]